MIHLNSQNKFMLIKTAFYLYQVHGATGSISNIRLALAP